MVFYGVDEIPGTTDYQWSGIPDLAVNVYGQGTRFLRFSLPFLPAGISLPFGGIIIGVQVVNSCGIREVSTYYTGIDPCGLALRRSMEVYPNPADYELNVEQTQLSLSAHTQPNGAFFVELYDALGRRVAQGKDRNQKVVLAVGHLPTGIYHLQGKDNDGQFFTHRVVLNR